MSNVNEPLQIELINRGEGAATGVGLFLGFIGLLITLALVAAAAVILLAAIVPMLLIALMLHTLRLIVRLDARHAEWVDEMRIVDHNL